MLRCTLDRPPAIGFIWGAHVAVVGFGNGEFWGIKAIVWGRAGCNRTGNSVETTSMAETETNTQRSQQIDAAIAEYLELVEQRTATDRDTFLAQHAEIADELRNFLATTVWSSGTPRSPRRLTSRRSK